ncbi:hypothetical protein U0070_023603, partial [Myodes glareolus]
TSPSQEQQCQQPSQTPPVCPPTKSPEPSRPLKCPQACPPPIMSSSKVPTSMPTSAMTVDVSSCATSSTLPAEMPTEEHDMGPNPAAVAMDGRERGMWGMGATVSSPSKPRRCGHIGGYKAVFTFDDYKDMATLKEDNEVDILYITFEHPGEEEDTAVGTLEEDKPVGSSMDEKAQETFFCTVEEDKAQSRLKVETAQSTLRVGTKKRHAGLLVLLLMEKFQGSNLYKSMLGPLTPTARYEEAPADEAVQNMRPLTN